VAPPCYRRNVRQLIAHIDTTISAAAFLIAAACGA